MITDLVESNSAIVVKCFRAFLANTSANILSCISVGVPFWAELTKESQDRGSRNGMRPISFQSMLNSLLQYVCMPFLASRPENVCHTAIRFYT